MTQDRKILHLIRGVAGGSEGADATIRAVAERDWVVYLRTMELAPQGEPTCPAGPIDHDQLVALAFAADLVVTW
jgi:hypothetical protein